MKCKKYKYTILIVVFCVFNSCKFDSYISNKCSYSIANEVNGTREIIFFNEIDSNKILIKNQDGCDDTVSISSTDYQTLIYYCSNANHLSVYERYIPKHELTCPIVRICVRKYNHKKELIQETRFRHVNPDYYNTLNSNDKIFLKILKRYLLNYFDYEGNNYTKDEIEELSKYPVWK